MEKQGMGKESISRKKSNCCFEIKKYIGKNIGGMKSEVPETWK
jgi:hypothetical protein